MVWWMRGLTMCDYEMIDLSILGMKTTSTLALPVKMFTSKTPDIIFLIVSHVLCKAWVSSGFLKASLVHQPWDARPAYARLFKNSLGQCTTSSELSTVNWLVAATLTRQLRCHAWHTCECLCCICHLWAVLELSFACFHSCIIFMYLKIKRIGGESTLLDIHKTFIFIFKITN